MWTKKTLKSRQRFTFHIKASATPCVDEQNKHIRKQIFAHSCKSVYYFMLMTLLFSLSDMVPVAKLYVFQLCLEMLY